MTADPAGTGARVVTVESVAINVRVDELEKAFWGALLDREVVRESARTAGASRAWLPVSVRRWMRATR